jgi:hypothetical protein
VIALTVFLVGLAMVGFGISSKRQGDRVIAEILAAEQRQIEREGMARRRAATPLRRAGWQS